MRPLRRASPKGGCHIDKMVLAQINEILDGNCEGCQTKVELTRGCKGNFSILNTHCMNVCEFGKRLKELGKKLGG